MLPIRQRLDLGSIELSCLEWNRGREPLLAIHGLGDCAVVWHSLGDYLAEKYHIIAPDMRGHGESGKPATGYAFADAIADLEALMNRLGWNNAHILGHSWGGKLAAIWATQNPQRFKSMILVDPIFITKMPSILKLTFPILYRTLDSFRGMGPFTSYRVAEAQAPTLGKYAGWSPLQKLVFKESIEQKPDGQWGTKFVVPARNQIFEEVMRVAGLTESIDIPTLFVQPAKGVNRTEWQLKPYKTYLTRLTLQKIAGNHWPFLVEPDIFNRTVEEFLSDMAL